MVRQEKLAILGFHNRVSPFSIFNRMFESSKTELISRFHSMAEAVIVIDEVQTVTNKMLSLFNLTVSFLAEACGSTVIMV